jgi:preprotein translocase subunit SecD
MTQVAAGPVLRPAALRAVATPGSAGWWLGLSAAILLALTAAIGTGAWQPGRLALHPPRLVMVLHPVGVPPESALQRATDLLRKRLAAAGYREPGASVTGPGTVTVRAGTDDADGLRGLAAPGRLSFHAILAGPVAVPPRACTRPPATTDGATTDPAATLVACEQGTGSYQLAPAGVGQADVAGVSAELDATVGWSARVRFTPTGQVRWAALAETARLSPVSRQVAVVVDGRVVAAPHIEQSGGDEVFIAVYGMAQAGSVRLAALLGYGPLPVVFAVSSVGPS